jgi:hypothetical protein
MKRSSARLLVFSDWPPGGNDNQCGRYIYLVLPIDACGVASMGNHCFPIDSEPSISANKLGRNIAYFGAHFGRQLPTLHQHLQIFAV